ncbi:MAG: flavin reductase family protein [Bacteroidota bacterium]
MERQIKHLIQEKLGMKGMNWIIEEEEIEAQSKLITPDVPFERVLAEMIHSFMRQMESGESPKDILSLEKKIALEDRAAMEEAMKAAMQKGVIYLFPSDYAQVIQQHQLPFSVSDLPRKFEHNWMFGFITPDLPDWYFIGFVNRSDIHDTYNTGFKKKQSAINKDMKTYDVAQLSTGEIYQLLTAVVAPRPIAFVSTVSEKGIPNLAPYSYFNAFSSDPPIVIFSSNIQASEPAKKDSLRNAESTGEVVINMVNYQIARQMAITNVSFPAEVNEFEKAGLTPIASEVVKPYRVKESPIQMECKVQQIIPLGTRSGAGNLVVCEVVKLHVDRSILDEKGRVHPHRVDLMGRLGQAYYVRASGESIHTIYQPRNKICIGYEQLPESAKKSGILTGNDLGQLAGLLAIPSQSEIEYMKSNDSIKELVVGAQAIENLHRRAKKLLASEKTMEAAALIWLAEEF